MSEPNSEFHMLDNFTKPAKLFKVTSEQTVRCVACAHNCVIKPNNRGICGIRFNKNGALNSPWGYVNGIGNDPIEKKPFYHVMPGELCLTFGMLGCNFHCGFCQNWQVSQVTRDPNAGGNIYSISPEELVDTAIKYKAKLISSSYNEPVITIEWAGSIFDIAKQNGLKCFFVSNGHLTQEAVDFLKPRLDGINIDLKTMNAENYKKLGGKLNAVLDGIKLAVSVGFWVEIVTLIVPGFNSSEEEMKETAEFIASVSKDIPWHVTAFHPDYKYLDTPPTSAKLLIRACEIGKSAGLNFVYAGNIPGALGDWEDTKCPYCSATLISRSGFRIKNNQISENGLCPGCGYPIPGIWK